MSLLVYEMVDSEKGVLNFFEGFGLGSLQGLVLIYYQNNWQFQIIIEVENKVLFI